MVSTSVPLWVLGGVLHRRRVLQVDRRGDELALGVPTITYQLDQLVFGQWVASAAASFNLGLGSRRTKRSGGIIREYRSRAVVQSEQDFPGMTAWYIFQS